MVHHWLLLFIFCFFGRFSWAQDERYYRQILSGELPKLTEEFKEGPKHKLDVLSALYKVDLNGDGIEESLQTQKRDGVDWLEIRDFSERKIFEAQLFSPGAESVLYKIKMVSLSAKVRTLILFLDEGFTAGKKFESTGRVFLVSFENNDLSTMKMTQGPHFFHEKEAQREQYYRRDYMVNVFDMNNDGIREIAIQYNHIQRVMQYIGRGEWKRY